MNTKKQIFKKAVAFFVIATILLTIGCSKNDSNVNDNNSNNYYQMQATVTYRGSSFVTEGAVTYSLRNNNCPGQAWGMTCGKFSDPIDIQLFTFDPNGGVVNGGFRNCDRPSVEASTRFRGGGGLYSKRDENNSLTLSGKTYTLTCNIWIEEDEDINGIKDGVYADVKYPIKVVWTKP
jgi:hypothetical protein